MKGPLMLRDVAPIIATSCLAPDTSEGVEEIVELPLREACVALYNKGIETRSSSANREGIERDGQVWILINYESLSYRNQAVARRAGHLYEDHHNNGGRMTLRLFRKVDWETTVEEVEEWALRTVEQFEEQPMTWVSTWTREALCQMYGLDPSDPTFNVYYFCTSGKAYDPEKELFYVSTEQMQQAKRLGGIFRPRSG